MLNRAARPNAPKLAGRGYSRLLDLLEFFVKDGLDPTISDVARLLRFPKSTAFLMLRHLVSREYIVMDPVNKRYHAGPTLLQLGFLLVERVRGLHDVRLHLEKLSRRTGEDVYLAIRTGTRLIYVDKVEGSHSVRVNIGLGVPRYLHCTSAGKVFLAYGPPALLEEVTTRWGLPKQTPFTITDPVRLRSELIRIRKLGWSMTRGESVQEILGIAAPLWDSTGDVRAAVHISTLRSRGLRRQKELVEALLDVTRAINREYRPGRPRRQRDVRIRQKSSSGGDV